MSAQKRALTKRPLLGEVLVELGLATQEQVDSATAEGQKLGVRMGELLVHQGVLSETALSKALAHQYQLDYLDLRGVEPSQKALSYIPYSVAVQATVLPIKVEDWELTIAVGDPSNVLELSRLEKLIPIDYKIVVAQERALRLSILNAYLKSSSSDKEPAPQEKEKKRPAVKRTLHTVTSTTGTEGEVEGLINRILEQAIGHQASDVHIEPQENDTHIRERIDGILESRMNLPLELHSGLVSRLKILGGLDIAEKRNPQDGRFVHMVDNKPVDFRISTMPTIRGEKVVLRILDKANMKIGLSNLGLNKDLEAKVKRLLAHPHGLMLVSGPTGSGKTTTVYSMLNYINSVGKNIITIEDPVEYKFEIINQVQVNNRAGLTFASLLRSILRQDPDIIMVGEIRDKETAEIAIRAALTGHLVISTIHTNDATTAVSRLIDMGIDPFLISSALLGVVGQRLVRKLCKHCQIKSKELNDSDSQLAADVFKQQGYLLRPKGCVECFNSGYSGREGIYELLVADKELRRAIGNEATVEEIRELVNKHGFRTMRMDGVDKVNAGITTAEEILRGTIDTDE